jgi:hypothetical protein
MDIKIYDPTKPDKMFNDLVSDNIQRQIASGLASEYKRAYEYCYENFAPPEAHDLLPHFRRVCIEAIMPDIAERIGGFKTRSLKNKAKNCCHRLIGGRCIILSQSKIEQRWILPRDAVFRKGYAADPQGVFDFVNEDEAREFEDRAPLYGIITHMPVFTNEKVPAFIDIIFPDRSYTKMVGAPIKLLNKFPEVIRVPREEQEESIPDSAKVALVQRGENA